MRDVIKQTNSIKLIKLILVFLMSLVVCVQIIVVNTYAFGLSNGSRRVPLGNTEEGQTAQQGTEETVAEIVEIPTEEVIEIEAEDGTTVEIETERFVSTSEVIEINISLAQVVVLIGLGFIIVGGIMSFGIDNPYRLPSVIIVSGHLKKRFKKALEKNQVSQKVPCKGDIYSIYLLALQAGLIDEQSIEKMSGRHKADLGREFLAAMSTLEKTGRIKFTMSYRKLKAYKLTKFGIEEVLEIVNFLNYMEFAIRNDKVRENEQIYRGLVE